MVKVYLTAHVISKGIEEVEGEFYGGAFRYTDLTGGRCSRFAFAPRNECFSTREEAVARAEEIRQNRLASLKAQIKRLKEIRFD